MKKHRLILSLALMASVTVFTGCKEEEVEKPIENSERLDHLRSELLSLRKDYLNITDEVHGENMTKEALTEEIAKLRKAFDIDYAVLVTDFQGTAIPGAKVETVVGGVKVEATTNEAGLATFTGLKRGEISAAVSVEGFTSASYTSSISTDGNDYAATTRILLFPKSGSIAETGLFITTGKLYYDANDNDDTLNMGTNPAGPNPSSTTTKYTQVTKADNIDVKAFLKLTSKPLGLSTSNSYGAIIDVAYDDAVFTATWNDDNTYSLKLPSKSVYAQSFDFDLVFEEFVKDKTLIVNNGSASKTAKTYTEKRIFKLPVEAVISEDAPGKTVVRNYFYSEYKN